MNPAYLTILVVTYNPDSDFYSRIRKVGFHPLNVVLFSNCIISKNLNEQTSNNIDNVFAYGTGINLGLSAAYNQVARAVMEIGCERILIFDQDTIIDDCFFSYINFLLKWHFDDYSALQLPLKSNNFFAQDGNNALHHVTSVERVKESSFLINSGTLFNLSALKTIGWFDESFFVDMVDYEFCIRSRSCGYRVGRLLIPALLDHSSLQEDNSISLFGSVFYFRVYPMARIKGVLQGACRLIFQCVRRRQGADALSLFRFLVVFSIKNLLGLIQFKRG